MRKITSQKEKESKAKSQRFIISLFMLALLVLSTVGYSFLSSTETADPVAENIPEGSVRNIGNQWIVRINGQDFYFSHSPEEVKDIAVPENLTLQDLAGQEVYVSSDNQAVISEISSTVGRFASRVQEACYGSCEKDLPEKDCAENLIVWTDKSENTVRREGKCIFIDGDMRAVDAFAYKILGLN